MGFYSHSECVSVRLDLFRVAVVNSLKVHERVTLEKSKIVTKIEVYSKSSPTKKRQRDDSQKNPLHNNNIQRQSKPPIIIVPEENGLSNFSSKTDIESKTYSEKKILTQSTVSLEKFLPALWECFIQDSMTSCTVDCTLRMFLSLLASENGTHEGNVLNQWKEDLVQILYPLCCKFGAEISKAGYMLLIFCLGHINFIGKKYLFHIATKCTSDANKQQARSMSDLLLGLNSGHSGRQTTSWSLQSIFLQQKSQLLYIADYQISGLLKLWSIILEAKN